MTRLLKRTVCFCNIKCSIVELLGKKYCDTMLYLDDLLVE
jgi:hypothetical protein